MNGILVSTAFQPELITFLQNGLNVLSLGAINAAGEIDFYSQNIIGAKKIIDLGNTLSYAYSTVLAGSKLKFYVIAYDRAGNESEPSNLVQINA